MAYALGYAGGYADLALEPEPVAPPVLGGGYRAGFELAVVREKLLISQKLSWQVFRRRSVREDDEELLMTIGLFDSSWSGRSLEQRVRAVLADPAVQAHIRAVVDRERSSR